MFYIEKKRVERKNEFAYIHYIPTVIVLISFLGLTFWNYNESKSRIASEEHSIIQKHMTDTTSIIQNRLAVYENLLRSSAGFVNSSEVVTSDEWKRYIDTFNVFERYPGVLGVGYSNVIKDEELNGYIANVQSSGMENFSIRPEGQREIYTSILFFEPSTALNQSAVGFDMYTEPLRMDAMNKARDSAQASLTDKTVLLQDVNIRDTPGFIMYMPVYSTHATPDTVEARRNLINSYTFAPFRAEELFGRTFINTTNDFQFEIYDGTVNPDNLLYKSTTSLTEVIASEQQTITVSGQDWVIVGQLGVNTLPYTVRTRPLNTLLGGLTFSFLTAGFIYLLLVNRTQSISRRESKVIQNAKDELLALASHQLRTPATGVKQYIGILKEGYAGTLTDEQMKYLEKAYASNERQLATINEMLYVARADAGHMDLSCEEFNFTKMLKDIIEEQNHAFISKKQHLKVRIPNKSLFLYGDQRFLRMAIENILSNATKYTPDHGTITVSIKSDRLSTKVIIEDTGVGVSKKDMPLLFEKFSRIPNELTNKVTGSGIGLYLARKIILGHKGTISFISKEGRGSRCEIKIPLKGPKSRQKYV